MWDFFSKVLTYIVKTFTPMSILFFIISAVIYFIAIPYESVAQLAAAPFLRTTLYLLVWIVFSVILTNIMAFCYDMLLDTTYNILGSKRDSHWEKVTQRLTSVELGYVQSLSSYSGLSVRYTPCKELDHLVELGIAITEYRTIQGKVGYVISPDYKLYRHRKAVNDLLQKQ